MRDPSYGKRLSEHLASELALALVPDLDVADGVEAALEAAFGLGLVISATVTGSQVGTIHAWVAAALAEQAVPSARSGEAPTPGEIMSVVREAANVAVGRLPLRPDGQGLRITITGVAPGEPPGGAHRYSITLGSGATSAIAVSVNLTPVHSANDSTSNLDLVLDVELPLVVRFGRTVMSLKSLASLGPGSVVDMGRSPDDPVELLVSDKLVAYGEVVIVDGSYGLRITDLVGRNERVRPVELT